MANPTRDALLKIIDKETILLRKMFDKLRTLASSVLALLGPVQAALQILVSKLSQIKAIVPSTVATVAKGALQFLKTMLNAAPKFLRQITKAIGEFHKAVRSKVLEGIIRSWQLLERLIAALLNTLKTTFQKLMEHLRPLQQITDTLQTLLGVVQAVFREVAGVIAQLRIASKLGMLVRKTLAALDEVLRRHASITKAVLVDGRKLVSDGG